LKLVAKNATMQDGPKFEALPDTLRGVPYSNRRDGDMGQLCGVGFGTGRRCGTGGRLKAQDATEWRDRGFSSPSSPTDDEKGIGRIRPGDSVESRHHP
jgi:hypothetical protein